MTNPFLRQDIRQASILMAFFSFASLAFGLLRESIVANYFGTTAQYDILLVALAIPLMVSSVILMAIPSAGIPYLHGVSSSDGSGASIHKSPFFKINTLLTFAIAAAVFFLLPLFRGILSSGLQEHEVDLVMKFGRIFCIIIPFRAYEAVFRSLLHVRRNFLFPVLTNLGFNIASIAVLVTLFPSFGSWAFVISWIAGAGLQVVIVAIPGYIICRQPDVASLAAPFPGARYTKFLGVIVLIEALGLVIEPFDRYLAGIFLQPGYVSATSYANVIYNVPLRTFVFSLGTAIFPELSENASRKDIPRLVSIYHKSIAICILMTIPLTAFSLLYMNELITLLFQRGKFVAQSTTMTAAVLKYYLLFLFFPAAFFIQMKVFYALKSWRYFTFIRIISLAVKCAMGLLLIKADWALAIGGGTVAMLICSFGLLEFYLINSLGLHYSRSDLFLILKALACSLTAVVLFLAVHYFMRYVLCCEGVAMMAVVGILGFIGLFVMDRLLRVSGVMAGKKILGF